MIDFRYHLVSIVSIFIALAVGIALGAGPLKDQVSDTITSDVTSLRKDKADLKEELAAADKAKEAKDGYIVESESSVLANALSGSRVDFLILPGSDTEWVDSAKARLATAGATIGATVTVESSWLTVAEDPALVSSLNAAATKLGIDTSAGDLKAVQPALLARSLHPAEPTLKAAAEVRTQLVRDGLLSVDADLPPSVSHMVIAAGALSGDDEELVASQVEALATLPASLHQAGVKTVVGANDANTVLPEGDVSVLAKLRGTADANDGVSTVDNVGDGLGQVSLALCLVEQDQGGFGNYGQLVSASAPYPSLKLIPKVP